MEQACEIRKVPFEVFLRDSKSCKYLSDTANEESVRTLWENLTVEKQIKKNSELYILHLPYSICLRKDSAVLIPTGFSVLCPSFETSVKYRIRKELKFFVNEKSTYIASYSDMHLLVLAKANENISLHAGDPFLTCRFMRNKK